MKLLILSVFLFVYTLIPAQNKPLTLYSLYKDHIPKNWLTMVRQQEFFGDEIDQIGEVDPTLIYLLLERYNQPPENRKNLISQLTLQRRESLKRQDLWLAAELDSINTDTTLNVPVARNILRQYFSMWSDRQKPDSILVAISPETTYKLFPKKYFFALIYLQQKQMTFSDSIDYRAQFDDWCQNHAQQANTRREELIRQGRVLQAEIDSVLHPAAFAWMITQPWKTGKFWYPLIVLSDGPAATIGTGLFEGPVKNSYTRLGQYRNSVLNFLTVTFLPDTLQVEGLAGTALQPDIMVNSKKVYQFRDNTLTGGAVHQFAGADFFYGLSIRWKKPKNGWIIPFSGIQGTYYSFECTKQTPGQVVTNEVLNELPQYDWKTTKTSEMQIEPTETNVNGKGYTIETPLTGWGWMHLNAGISTMTYTSKYRHDYRTEIREELSVISTGQVLDSIYTIDSGYHDSKRQVSRQWSYLHFSVVTPFWFESGVEISPAMTPVWRAALRVPLWPLFWK